MDLSLAIKTIKDKSIGKDSISEYIKVFEYFRSKQELVSDEIRELINLVYPMLLNLQSSYKGKSSPPKASPKNIRETASKIADWFLQNYKSFEFIVKEIDPSLTFVKRISSGVHAVVLLVRQKSSLFALKLNKNYESYDPMGKEHTLEHEFNILKKLKSIRRELGYGVPLVIRFYKDAPCVNDAKRGKNAMLMEFIDGQTLRQSGPQRIGFFVELRQVIEKIFKKGICPPIVDFNASNVMVLNSHPVMIDFMCAFKLSLLHSNEQKRLALDRFKRLEQKYELR